MTTKRKMVLWDNGRGLRWRWAYQAVNEQGKPVGYPQATRKLALAWAKG